MACILLLVSANIWANQEILAGTLTGDIRKANIMSAYAETAAPGIKVRSVVGEPLIGTSENMIDDVVVNVGLLTPNQDLIFRNNLERE